MIPVSPYSSTGIRQPPVHTFPNADEQAATIKTAGEADLAATDSGRCTQGP